LELAENEMLVLLHAFISGEEDNHEGGICIEKKKA
jgi:hypothetical protein